MPPRVVVCYSPEACGYADDHERITRTRIAQQLATLQGLTFDGDHDPARHDPERVYLVPGDTLVGIEAARALGVAGEDDLFGAVVPHAFAATKVISHPLVAADAKAPAGWPHALGAQLAKVTLTGFSAFSLEDAAQAGRHLLERGPVRLKHVCATAGRGQAVVQDARELEAGLAELDGAEVSRHGLVLEENLVEVTTYSIGQVRVMGLVASYYGTQRLTPDNQGQLVYGGSDLTVVPGGFDRLARLDLPQPARLAAEQARAYDAAAAAAFPAFFASRRNYDVACGRDGSGRWRSGVLEQSWRLGGASGAEVLALAAFRAEPRLRLVRASTYEIYGKDIEPPPPAKATVYFHGTDRQVGPLLKYAAVLERHDHA